MLNNTPAAYARIMKTPGQAIALVVLSGILGGGLTATAAASNSHPTPDAAAPTRAASPNTPPAEENVVAIIAGHKITTSDLDKPLRMQLHELERARYELRLQQLGQLIAQQARTDGTTSAGATPAAEIFLEPPEPPRFTVDAGNNAVRGNPGAPVTIVQFLDFESPHSQRAQPVLHRLLEDYAPLVRLVVRDLPLPYHRHARQAALAAECARAQGRYWRYHDLLLQDRGGTTPASLRHHATALGLDLEAFQSCLDDEAGAAAVGEDMQAAQRLGLHSTPVFFVNGLYRKGPAKYDDLARLINRELVQAGILHAEIFNTIGIEECPFTSAARSRLPLSLIGTVTEANPARSTAVLENHADGSTRTLRPGERPLEAVELVLVTGDRVFLQRDDRLEFLPLSRPDAPPAAIAEQDAAPPVAADAVLRLPGAEIDRALADTETLESVLAPGTLDLEGNRLLKLMRVEPGSLYDRLGLQARDVLMQVDGAWVHDSHNPLWDALRKQEYVTLTIMRRGFPRTFRYVITGQRD